jgi:glycosyltransferase involved in cell wall biosynthesis
MGAPLFDNAPVAVVEAGPPKAVTFVYPYYENPDFFARQLDLWGSYPEQLRSRLQVIVVDDGSPDTAAEAVVKAHGAPLIAGLRVFRIEVDVRWNWLAARNIGMRHARRWCVLTDMDHMVPAETLARLVGGDHDPEVIYRFSRKEATGDVIHSHPNSMFMTRDMFWKVGGYDEALSGHYGTDGEWRRRCAATAKILTLP